MLINVHLLSWNRLIGFIHLMKNALQKYYGTAQPLIGKKQRTKYLLGKTKENVYNP